MREHKLALLVARPPGILPLTCGPTCGPAQAAGQAQLDEALVTIKAGVRQREGWAAKERMRDTVRRARIEGTVGWACWPAGTAACPPRLPGPANASLLPVPTRLPLSQLHDWFLKGRNPETGEYPSLPDSAKGGSRHILHPPPPQPTPGEAAAAAAAASKGKAAAGKGKAGAGTAGNGAPQLTQAFLEGLREAVQAYVQVWQGHAPADPIATLRECWGSS